MKLTAKIRLVKDGAVVPDQASEDDVGYDLCAGENTEIMKGELAIIPTGLIVEPPKGYNFEVRLRSSTPRKYGLLIPHGMGTIDPSYCGHGDELGVPVYKFSDGTKDKMNPLSKALGYGSSVMINKGDRIAQLVLVKTNYFQWEDVTDHPHEGKTRGGFGSTGE